MIPIIKHGIFLHNRTGNGDIQCRYVKRTGMVGSHTNNIALQLMVMMVEYSMQHTM